VTQHAQEFALCRMKKKRKPVDRAKCCFAPRLCDAIITVQLRDLMAMRFLLAISSISIDYARSIDQLNLMCRHYTSSLSLIRRHEKTHPPPALNFLDAFPRS